MGTLSSPLRATPHRPPEGASEPVVLLPVVPIHLAPNELTRRLREVFGDRTNESVAEWAGCSAESIRRYLMGQPPPAKFLAAVCVHEHICADWLLLGQGVPRRAQRAGEAVRASDLATLLAEIGRRLDGLGEGRDRT